MDIIEQLKRDEGTKLHAYHDSVGLLTIGTGRMIDLRRGGGISQEEADYLLANDVRRVKSELSKSLTWLEDLDEARQGALINMAFQLGTAGLLAFRKSIELIRQGKFTAAHNELLDSVWARQTPARAQRIAKQIQTGIWQ